MDTRIEMNASLFVSCSFFAPLALVAVVLLAAGCASTGGQPSAAPAGVIESTLPPIPPVTGPLDLYVEYPDSLQRMSHT